jgi:hypothetical protein
MIVQFFLLKSFAFTADALALRVSTINIDFFISYSTIPYHAWNDHRRLRGLQAVFGDSKWDDYLQLGPAFYDLFVI